MNKNKILTNDVDNDGGKHNLLIHESRKKKMLLSLLKQPSVTLRFLVVLLLLLLLHFCSSKVTTEEKIIDAEEEVDFDLKKIPLIDLKPWFINNPTNDDDDDSKIALIANKKKKKNDIVEQVAMACREVGFFMIINHGFDSTTENQTWIQSKKFFNLPLTQKLKYKTYNETEYPYGYEQSEQLSKGKQLDNDDNNHDDDDDSQQSRQQQSQQQQTTIMTTDRKETFAIGPNNIESGMPLRRWIMNNHNNENNEEEEDDDDDDAEEFRHALETYYTKMESLANTLLEIFALALELPHDYFVTKMDHHMSALRLVHYYPLLLQKNEHEHDDYNDHDNTYKNNNNNNDSDNNNIGREKIMTTVVRAGAHTDYGALTILNAKSSGLQVQLPTTKEWYPVPVIPDALIINLGDLMQRWTNDQWISTLHRVVMPTTTTATTTTRRKKQQQQQQEERRYSIAYFVNINGDTIIENLDTKRSKSKYKPITAKEHLMSKHLASMNEETVVVVEEEGEDDVGSEGEGETQRQPQQSDEL